jgi:maleamate amidohydrolase
MAGSVACELDERIAAAQPDVVLHKTVPSLFFGTPAGAILTRERVDTVIVAGCITSGCVRASIIDAFSLGFRVQVAQDCVGAFLFLASNEMSGYITGNTVHVNGGMYMP